MLTYILLQAPQGGGNPFISLLFPLLIIIVFWFFLIRPQVKRQREQQKFIDSLREGMEVVTSAGIIGKVTKIDGNVVRLLIDERTFIRVLKQTITGEFKP
ncbi:MAG: preprotein translocase subunit YajC [Saprospiraceae bacterium]|nr:preprotein translocase subunit YajC [Saprospiraceae bacterium]MDW8228354.1 preprotein translocase subunit YajC [Saprospiraceae bacterium]